MCIPQYSNKSIRQIIHVIHLIHLIFLEVSPIPLTVAVLKLNLRDAEMIPVYRKTLNNMLLKRIFWNYS